MTDLIRNFGFKDIDIGDYVYVADIDEEGDLQNLEPYKVIEIHNDRQMIDVESKTGTRHDSSSKGTFRALQKRRVLNWKKHLLL